MPPRGQIEVAARPPYGPNTAPAGADPIPARWGEGDSGDAGDHPVDALTMPSPASSPRAPGVSHPVPGAAVPHRVITDQIALAVRPGAEGSIEITLQPEELGRVRMVIRPRDDGLSMVLAADRPETLELIRRHATDLDRALQRAGFDSIDLSFGQGARGGQASGGDAHQRGPAMAEPEPGLTPATAAPPRRSLPSDGLDIRL